MLCIMKQVVSFENLGKKDLAVAGGKAANLGELMNIRLPVPEGFVVTTRSYDEFVEWNGMGQKILKIVGDLRVDDAEDLGEAEQKIKKLFLKGEVSDELERQVFKAYEALGCAVAVRSSATAEDLESASFAGQQETFLNVQGRKELMKAVKKCWASLWTGRAISYREQNKVDHKKVSLAVVIQKMVEADSAGIMFTINPTNGQENQALISASWGLGEAIVSGLVSPDVVVMDKNKKRMISYGRSKKEKMIVVAEKETEVKDVSWFKRKKMVLKEEAALKLLNYALKIEKHYQRPMDIEWAKKGDQIFILQARPITALPEHLTNADWSVPKSKILYARASIAEMMPTPLSPLFETMVRSSVEKSISKIIKSALVVPIWRERDIKFMTVNGFAYYGFAVRLWQILLIFILMPIIMVKLMISGVKLWREQALPKYKKLVKLYSKKKISEESVGKLISGIDELVYEAAVYYTSVQLVMSLVMTSEIVFTGFYNTFVKKDEDAMAASFLLGFDSAPINAEKSLFDLASWCLKDKKLCNDLKNKEFEKFDFKKFKDFKKKFDEHLRKYGYTIYNMDFMYPVPSDEPRPIFDTLKFYLEGKGENPYTRQKEAADFREKMTRKVLKKTGWLRGKIFKRLLRFAQKYAPLREDSLADIGLAWPRVREMIFELGERLVKKGVIVEKGDIFYLEKDELKKIQVRIKSYSFICYLRKDKLSKTGNKLEKGGMKDDYKNEIEERKKLMEEQKRMVAPILLPEDYRFFGLDLSKMMPAQYSQQFGNVIKGVGASKGKVTGIARVLKGPEDFGEMEAGEILVASITTPAWTPLFAKAAGVVTDIGGPMSHSSIVAREYGIPAVLGTGVASKRIKTGDKVVVDGDGERVELI